MAAGRITMKVTGVKELEQALKELAKKTRNKIVRQSLRKETKTIAERAQDNMPVEKGTARKAIVVRTAKSRKRGQIRFTVIYKAEPIFVASRKPSQPEGWFYPAAVEYGVPQDGRPPEAPMRRAFDSEGQAAADRAAQEIVDGIIREAKTT